MKTRTKKKKETKKTCTRCGLVQAKRLFPHTLARGRMMARSWCNECLKEYYREHSRKKKRDTSKAK